ncbi:apolipoprotein N-acyltransferase [Limnohabitans sp. Hippo3]|uniref:apolipoprotein N-acyltransferase n=1 Tax=Limnohabitans sp. Hippo3 TaxID=1597956 RepID=UPI000D35E868|nr:apolipoprotein N-acyltransferase [Limnohabitans sp. Hippo3]PUE37069.1 apolipoprotein N-acyltransferase [Limnohabitans sp. Hippo3]
MNVGPERARGLSTMWPALAGAAQAASIAMPGSGQAQGWLQVLSLAALAAGLARMARHTPSVRAPYRQAAWSGGVFATTWLAGSFWWLYVSMHDVGGLPAPLAALAVCALAGALALYYAAASAAWLALARGVLVHRPGAASVLFAALWTLAELMRGRWLTGFPWGAGGYAHVDGVLSVWAPWVGVYGMGALAAWLAMRLALSGWRLRALKPLLGLGLVSWGLQAWGPSFTTSAGAGQVALLQANISQSVKFDAASGIRDALQWYDAQLRANQQPLVVAPETAIPLLPRHLPEGYWSGLQAHFAQPGRPVALVGVPLGSLDEGYSNSVVALGPQGAAPYRYDKSHLVPFGEFMPPGFAWFIRMMNIPLGDFKSGGWDQASLAWQGQRLAPNVCYEDLFGEELAIRFKDPATAPTALVNVSNIAWFGDTLAVDQHLSISRLRAMELGRPMLRATNTGATAIIDHTGRVTDQLPRFTRGSLTGSFEGRHGLTPFARWASAWGLAPLWALCCVVVAWAFWRRQRP